MRVFQNAHRREDAEAQRSLKKSSLQCKLSTSSLPGRIAERKSLRKAGRQENADMFSCVPAFLIHISNLKSQMSMGLRAEPALRLGVCAPLRFILFVGCLLLGFVSPLAAQTLDKGHQILINRGIQLQGLVINYDVFHLSTFQSGNFTTLHWLWDSTPALMGTAPGIQWGRW